MLTGMQPVESLVDTASLVELFEVVFNHEQQYSIWPQNKRIPDGWYAAEISGPKADCLEYIERVWTDMRPLSLRRAMDVSSAG
jgi:MbtH protein